MKVNEIMERCNLNETGRAIAYIKDALDEMNVLSETHIKNGKIDIVKDQRFYDFPADCVKILDIRCKNHNNTKDEYRSIPRLIYEPELKDADGY